MISSLKTYLHNWKDADVAKFYLGTCLGLWSSSLDDFRDNKGIFWSDNKLGNLLFNILDNLVQNGILEFDDKEVQFRWNPDYEIE